MHGIGEPRIPSIMDIVKGPPEYLFLANVPLLVCMWSVFCSRKQLVCGKGSSSERFCMPRRNDGRDGIWVCGKGIHGVHMALYRTTPPPPLPPVI